jgi:thioredoxin-related protein
LVATPPEVPRSPKTKTLVYGGIIAWVAVCVALGTYLLASHLLTLPAPSPVDPVLHQAIAAHRRIHQRDRWLVLHVVFDECACSERVLDHLLADPRPPGVAERIILVTEHRAARAAWIAAIPARGFELDVVTPEQLAAEYHIEAAPLLVIVDPHDTVRYVGGYTPRKQAADVRDLAVIAAVQRGEAVEPLPTFGCAISRALNSRLDPLGIRRN